MAATSVLKLVVDDKEYSASLKNAKQGMQDLQQSLEKAGKSFTDCDQAVVDYAKGLGQMEATSKTAKGQIGEMSSAFVELSRVYRQMTEQEQQSPVGQALSQSLETLKQRTIDAKNELANLNKQLEPVKQETQQTGGVMDMLKDKLTINIDAMKMFEWGMKAAGVALDTLRGAIESTEAGHDALARAMAATDSITNQFLRSLANADFSNFITGLGDIVNKAVEAYNALDEFESYAARFQPWQQAKESEIQTKMMQARAAKAQGDTERAERLNEEAKRLIDELATSTKEYGKKQAESGFAAIKNLMGTVDISDQQIAWFADPKHWDEAKDAAESFRKKMEEIDKLGQSSITATSYDQHTRTQNRQRQREIEASITQRERQAYTMMNLRDSGESQEAAQLKRALQDIYGNVLADSRIESLRARADRMSGILTGTTTGGGGGTRTQVATPQQQAAKKVEDAEYEYAKTLEQAAIELKAGTYDEVGEKKKELQALNKLWQSYGDAYRTYADPKYKDAQDKTAAEIIKLGGEVKGMTDAQEAAKKAAQELAAAEKKLADAQQKLADARATGSATAIYKAQQEVERQRENVQKVKYEIDVQAGKVPDWLPKDSRVTMTVTVDDAQALEEIQKIQGVAIEPKTFSIMPSSDEWLDTLNGIEELEIPDKEISVKVDDAEALEKLKKLQGISIDPKTVKVEVEDTGKTNFENLQQTIQAEVKFDQMKVDEATLHTILKDSIQRGIDTTRLQLEPISEQIAKGIDVPETTWQKILDDYNKLREQIGEEPIDIDFNTGNKKEKKTDTKGLDKFNADFSKVTGGVSSIVSGIQSMGVEIPKEIQSVLGVLSGISSIMTGITAILTLIQLDTKVTAAATVADAAIPFAHGGIVPHAANGYYVPGRSYSGDNTPIMANAGELVLNTSSQQTLANDIMMAQTLVGMIENMYQMGSMGLTRSQQSGMSSELGNGIKIDVIGKLQGEDMVLMCDRWGRRTGKGELLFAKNL